MLSSLSTLSEFSIPDHIYSIDIFSIDIDSMQCTTWHYNLIFDIKQYVNVSLFSNEVH